MELTRSVAVRCDYFDTGRCRSCTLLDQPYPTQLAEKQREVAALLPTPAAGWSEPVASAPAGFRNKAKMVVGGTAAAPTLGILDRDLAGVDLRECRLHTPGLHDALPVLADFIARADLAPYDVAQRRGELKHLLVTESPAGELMVRFVCRSQEPVARLRKHLPWLLERLPVAVATVNLQPDHKAVLEGERELVLTPSSTLAMPLGAVTLHLRPRSFFQTNTAMAVALYAEASAWVAELAPASVWDLYCGVGGFALHLAAPGRAVTGVEISAEAVRSAEHSAAAAGLSDARFVAGDATAYALDAAGDTRPDLVVVNPPRRGIGDQLAGWLEGSGVPHVLYSSCNARTLAADLAAMPSYAPVRGRLLDMFPNTRHYEVLVLLRRR
ncbi:23S rRNA (uracil(747)-C(5))-methyltransferase RlmC [Nocardioides sp. zg-579]|uniref:23S rRNA (Uracil(747)-C(5))-methyltransferase RlmC n=1 Tax=Nocardioides marmotae TaxID=2663857 RepID=A0A6I3J9F6_9ACTN|nr:23S rRNA (uracil(747)-C(5))-methyltransferase RlmC [Nocardioides marmotae]MCR6030384.1 23S rRNA (uracil(747)-C(5))-methyltransferase RlmC [Gordonia jinghuaiqii]MTB94018.1 23S rRNA (uracil(747)-C(5))-methyltransferase RlmC [Nocardioides marmotae]QKE00328.1 23S rRNA (uracil(747)-C(5))-methyltransferase RlmC [Nocardioides marmotae]